MRFLKSDQFFTKRQETDPLQNPVKVIVIFFYYPREENHPSFISTMDIVTGTKSKRRYPNKELAAVSWGGMPRALVGKGDRGGDG